MGRVRDDGHGGVRVKVEAKAKKFSGVIFVRTTPQLHAELWAIAKGSRPARSVNEEVVLALEDHVAAERKKKGGRS